MSNGPAKKNTAINQPASGVAQKGGMDKSKTNLNQGQPAKDDRTYDRSEKRK